MIYFVSDIHLGAGTAEQARRTEDAFCRWLDSIASDVEQLYLLGDIFDFWFEYERVVPKGCVRVLGRLAEMSRRGVRITFYVGNHDMWCGDYLTEECGVRVVYAPAVEDLAGRRVHLAHGDNLNIKDKPMLRLMNGCFRSSVARWLFKWLIHPDLALKFGHWWSGKSRKSHGSEPITPAMLDFLVRYAREHRTQNTDVSLYIFGHMHLGYLLRDAECDLLFLSDWSGREATYATMDAEGKTELKTFEIL
jgi:UDP-2,3-diacylglucosamine hydrolase